MTSDPSGTIKQGTVIYFDFGPPAENKRDEGLLREKHFAVVVQMSGLCIATHYPVLLVCGLTSTAPKRPAGWITVPGSPQNGLDHESYLDVKRIYTVRKDQVLRVVGTLEWDKLQESKRLLVELFALERQHLR